MSSNENNKPTELREPATAITDNEENKVESKWAHLLF